MMSRRHSTSISAVTTSSFFVGLTLLLLSGSSKLQQQHQHQVFVRAEDANPFCLICPNGNVPTKGSGLVGSRQCAEVYQQGINKELTSSECSYVQILLAQPQDTCGCGTTTSPSSPTGPTTPTPAPTVASTPAPTTSAPTVDPREPCNVCGQDEDLDAFNPGAFIDPTIGLSCGQYQDFAISPGLTPEECTAARIIAIPKCGCRAASFLPTPAPAPTPTTAAPTVAPEPKVFCPVCTNGNPSFSNVAIGGEICGALDYDGRRFKFTQSECLTIQAAAATAPDDPCDCSDP